MAPTIGPLAVYAPPVDRIWPFWLTRVGCNSHRFAKKMFLSSLCRTHRARVTSVVESDSVRLGIYTYGSSESNYERQKTG